MRISSEKQETEMIQTKWEESVRANGLDKLNIPVESMSIIQQYFSLGFKDGTTVTFETIAEIYHHDPNVFEEIFEKH